MIKEEYDVAYKVKEEFLPPKEDLLEQLMTGYVPKRNFSVSVLKENHAEPCVILSPKEMQKLVK
ncbi:MAG: hypothetical protein LBK03_06700, partial [Bacteroidales bacterium]|nr:hypothetical protein [Bacteroidales bacterium]